MTMGWTGMLAHQIMVTEYEAMALCTETDGLTRPHELMAPAVTRSSGAVHSLSRRFINCFLPFDQYPQSCDGSDCPSSPNPPSPLQPALHLPLQHLSLLPFPIPIPIPIPVLSQPQAPSVSDPPPPAEGHLARRLPRGPPQGPLPPTTSRAWSSRSPTRNPARGYSSRTRPWIYPIFLKDVYRKARREAELELKEMDRRKYNSLRRRQIRAETEAWEKMVEEYRELEREMRDRELAPNLPRVKALFLGGGSTR
ncbi:hypothetical protein NL676_009755 [Syzygium grande]|nr:hypothetical protein NL676_009755 [Syzygium grande]